MKLKLIVVEGPHSGKEFVFEGPDTFLVGRSIKAHFGLPKDDPYFSRKHFLIEINPPRCRVMDLKSRNGTYVNGQRIQHTELKHGDRIKAGHTVLEVLVGESTNLIDLADSNPPVIRTTSPFPTPMTGSDYDINMMSDEVEIKEHPDHFPDIPGFRIDREIGQGGMGIVYKALRESDKKKVAIKVIKSSQAASEKNRQKFLREMEVLEGLAHPNIVQYLGSGEFDHMLYLVMQYISGIDAEQFVRNNGPLPVNQAVRIICQVLMALDYAHAKGFVHRDVKPSNILIDHQKSPLTIRLGDFGLARAFQVSQISGLTMQGEFGGTLAFISPEQITHFRDVRPTGDQFSTAASLYYLLTGKTIYDMPTGGWSVQLQHILTEKWVPIHERKSDIPNHLAAIIHRALAPEPEDRFADAQEMLRELRKVLPGDEEE